MPFYFCLNQNIKETITFKSQTLKNPRKSEKIQVKQKKVFFCKNCKIYLFSSVDYGKHLSGHGVHEAMLKCENLVADQKCEYPIDHKLQKPKLHGADQKQVCEISFLSIFYLHLQST